MSKKIFFIMLVLSLGLMVVACTNHYSIETEFSDGGVIELSSTQDEYEEGKEITAEAIPHEGYEFSYWSGDRSGEENPITFEIEEDMEIEAQFERKEYEVSFKDYEEEIDSQIIKHGESATAPREPSKDGYEFVSWDRSFDNVESDLTVEAQFEAKQYEVTFRDHRGKIDSQIVEHGGRVDAPQARDKDGYQFSSWDRSLSNITEDITIRAEYVAEDMVEDMVLVEVGTTSEDNGSVTVEEAFYIDKYQVTQAEFKEVMGFNPSYFNDVDHPDLEGNTADRPVEIVTWYDAVKYANKLSESEGLEKYYNISDIEYKGEDAELWRHPQNIAAAEVTENEGANGYRLPIEDEWEYAARGGRNGNSTTYAGSDDLGEVGWYVTNSDVANSEEALSEDAVGLEDGVGTMPVGELAPNELGLYDMSGNVSEWANTGSGSLRVSCGGSWGRYANRCEVSSSFSTPPRTRKNIGFRLARSL